MKNLIEVPTYWAAKDDTSHRVYDHPPPISEEGTLGRLLESLTHIDIDDTEIMLFPAPTHPEVGERVREIASAYSDELQISIFSASDLQQIHGWLDEWAFEKEFKRQFSMEGYGRVRSMGLVMGAVKNADTLILLDDDEIVEDVDFIKKATEFIGSERDGKIIGGIAGYYLNQDRRYLLSAETPWWKRLWNKEKMMNDAFQIIGSPERLKETTFAFGGNMVIHKSLYERVPFDPYNTRGEDIDFMFNAKHLGFAFLLDTQLKITHLPPQKYVSYASKMQQDIYRFMYQREKLRYYGITPSALDPYPGYFLRKSLGARAFITSIALMLNSLTSRDGMSSAYAQNAKLSLGEAKRYAKENVPKYFEFQKKWELFMSRLTTA